jgi:CRP-like cAMP-binding protein
MALNNDIETLSKVPLFAAFDREALRLVAFSAESRIFRAGDVVFRKGEPSDGGYVVMSGMVALDAADDGSPTSHLAGPGSLIGEIALIIDTERPATAIVREPASMLKVTRRVFRKVLEEYPDAALAIRQDLAARLTGLAGRLGAVRRRLMALDEFNPLPLDK